MSETESFIEEVSEEVRRDKLFALFRKYGWIAGLAVVLIVGGAAYNEWRNAKAIAAAQALGDGVMAALEKAEASERAAALKAVNATSDDSQMFVDILEAAAQVETDDKAAALALLEEVEQNPKAPEIYRQLAMLKRVILSGSDQDRDTRLATLDELATPGNPFRVLAMEQKALAFYEFGDNDAAIEILLTILDEPGATQALLQRAQQLIVALGGTLSEPDEASDDNG